MLFGIPSCHAAVILKVLPPVSLLQLQCGQPNTVAFSSTVFTADQALSLSSVLIPTASSLWQVQHLLSPAQQLFFAVLPQPTLRAVAFFLLQSWFALLFE